MSQIVSLYACPLPAALPEVTNQDCTVATGNIIAIALQLRQASASFNTTSIKVAATWTPLLSASDATGIKLVNVQNFESTPGEAITEGGNDQTTFRGRKKVKYMGFTDFTAMAEGVSHAYAKTLTEFTKFSSMPGQRSKLQAYFLTDENYIMSAADFSGIDIHAWLVGDVKKGGAFKLEDNYAISFSADYGWSFDAVSTLASFDVSTLVNA